MSGVGDRLRRILGAGPDATGDLRRIDERSSGIDEHTRAAIERHEALIRQLTEDLTGRVDAIEQRLAALEARDR